MLYAFTPQGSSRAESLCTEVFSLKYRKKLFQVIIETSTTSILTCYVGRLLKKATSTSPKVSTWCTYLQVSQGRRRGFSYLHSGKMK